VPNLRCGTGECVPPTNLCDGEYDCADGQDERNCRANSRFSTFESLHVVPL
jgi:hypothetical protein